MLKASKSQSRSIPVTKPGKLWNGPGTHEIPVELFATNRERLIERLRQKVPGKPVVLLQGGTNIPFYDSDTFYEFRQEPFFMWAFGVSEPGCYGAIDVQTKTSYLFVPRLPDTYQIYKGPKLGPQEYVVMYEIAKVYYVDEIVPTLKQLNCTVLLTLRGTNTDSNLTSYEAHFPGIDKFQINSSVLYEEMSDLRVFKTDLELDVMKYVNDISSEAHRKVMQFAQVGKTEYQCEAEFLHYCYSTGGCRHAAYNSICASNGNASFLHYGHDSSPNTRIIEPGDMCVFDMGASYFGYCADITCTFPISGKFSPTQKQIYEAVLVTSTTIFKQLKAGVLWTDMHVLAHKTLLGELKKFGILKGDVDQMVSAGLGGIFHPHGVGHFLGLNVHDVGGFIGGKRGDQKITNTLRTTRVLAERMVLALEPACYFNKFLLNEALNNVALSRYIVPEVLKKYKSIGGVKIEDNVLITKHGAINLTKVPRTVQEIENWLAGKDSNKYNF